MFTINPNITDLKVKERTIFKMLYSMNSHQVATPEMNVEDARCYILFFSEGASLSSYIGLYLPSTDRKFFYSYSSNPFPYEAVSDVENEARAFAEDMGFLLDEISLSGMPAEDKNRWIEEQFIFGYKKPEVTPEETSRPEQGAKPEAASAPTPAAAPAPASEAAPPAAPTPAEPAPAPQEAGVSPAAAQPAAPVQAPPQQPVPQPQAPPAPQVVQTPAQMPQQYVPPQPQTQPVQPQMQPQVHIHIQQPVPPQPAQQQPAPRKPSPSQQKPQPARRQTKPAAPAAPRPQVEPLVEEAAPSSIRPDDLIQEAVKSGVMRQPKQKLTKDMRSTTGVVARDKEALARLMASF